MDGRDALLGGQRRGLAVQGEHGLTRGQRLHDHVMEGERPEPDAEGLEQRLLGREARRQAVGEIAGAVSVALGGGEQPLGELRSADERGPEAVDVDQIEADADDQGSDRQRCARSLIGTVSRSITSMSARRSSRKVPSVSVTQSTRRS